jgi:CubicO group peptidase (beta-lactamase class C family)
MKAAGEYSKANGGQTLVVLFDGKRVFEQYDNGGAADQLQGLVSGVKSFVGVVAVAAVGDGLIRLDDPAAESITEWKDDPAKAKITYRQLLNMTSGLTPTSAGREGKSPSWKDQAARPMAAGPGERFQYGAFQHNVFAYALEQKLRPESFAEFLERRVLDPLGVKLEWRMWCEDGNPWVGGGGYMTARDWAVFGEFVRQGGNWKGKQIIDEKLLAECFRGTPQNPAYGLTWWLKAPVSPDLVSQIPILSEEWGQVANSDWLPHDLAAAFGGGKQRLFVIPSLKLVIVRQGKGTKEFTDTEFLSLLLRGRPAGK